jgi:penicillin-binding protein 1C
MRDTLAVQSATPLWSNIMHRLVERDGGIDAPSETLVRREICATTGLLPSQFTRETRRELFLRGTEPTAGSATMFTSDGHLRLPESYAAWVNSSQNNIGARVSDKLRITNPVDGAIYKSDSDLAAAQQMVEFTASAPNVVWTLNGNTLRPQKDGRVFWQLTPGTWTLTATSAATREQAVFTVD